MGRAGAGGGGSSHHSSGGHSMSSRSSGGHHISSGNHSRPGGSVSSGGSGFNHNSYPRHSSYHYYDSMPVSHINWQMPPWMVIAIGIVFAVFVLGMLFMNQGDIPKSTVNREVIQNPVGFENNCIIDELNWVDQLSGTEKRLQSFYEATGVQPFVYLKKYDASLQTDEDKIAYANDYYDKHIDNEYTFLVVYFGEQDVDNDVGFMSHVCGKSVTTVMDSEAIDIFWSYWDSNWYSDKSTDDVIADSFDSTAKRIMTKTKTGADVLFVGGIILAVVIVGCVITVLLRMRYKREKERAQETQDLLNTPLERLDSDELRDKYL